MEELTFDNGFVLKWTRGLDGGGSTQYTDFLGLLNNKGKRYTHGLEWCSGLGAIGYSILDAGLCEYVSFMDLYSSSKDYTIINSITNNVEDKVSFYHLDAIHKLPIELKFDLVVANPPHCPTVEIENFNANGIRMIHDDGWKIHHEFFMNIKSYLEPGADIFLSEIAVHEQHIAMATEGGLTFKGTFPAPALCVDSHHGSVIMHYRYET